MPNPLPIVMFGAGGRMGRMIMACAAEDPGAFRIVGAVEYAGHEFQGKPLAEWIPGAPREVALAAEPPADVPADTVAVHFSTPEATLRHLEWNRREGRPAVVGTTGFDDVQRQQIKEIAAAAPILLTPNTSRGVNVLAWLAAQAARLLGDYDVEIIEVHHHHKKDSPSGTALRLAQGVLDARGGDGGADLRHGRHGTGLVRVPSEIGMHALRCGDVVGDHTVILAGPGERIELTHRAHSREVLARGALKAATWLRGRSPKLYTMQDMLGL